MRGLLPLYLVRRGPDFAKHMHPSLVRHPVIVCTARHTAMWQAAWTGDRAWIWNRPCENSGEGWLIIRWNGLDIDYGHIVRGGKLPDGTTLGFSHPGKKDRQHRRPWRLLRGATWWSEHPLPVWLRDRWGVKQATDAFTLKEIEEDNGLCMLPFHVQEQWRRRREARAERKAAAGGGA